MVNRKAQTATEYLIILAVVIVIALIVVGIMGGIPGIGTGVESKTSASYWKSAPIAVDAYSISPTGVTLVLRNNMGSAIDVTNIALGATNLTNLPGIMSPGATYTVNDAAVTCTGATNTFSYDVTITYTDQATGAEYDFTGDGHKLEGSCAK